MSPSMIETYRRDLSTAASPPGAAKCKRSVIEIFYGTDWDPALKFSVGQIAWWLTHWISHSNDSATLAETWQRSLAKLKTCAFEWAKVSGPISATQATIFMYGWLPIGPV